jgi:DNA-binding XRE family transcriptional regulator
MTQAELARCLDVARQTLNHWEQGDRSISLDWLARIAQVLEVRGADLVAEALGEAGPDAAVAAQRVKTTRLSLQRLQEDLQQAAAALDGVHDVAIAPAPRTAANVNSLHDVLKHMPQLTPPLALHEWPLIDQQVASYPALRDQSEQTPESAEDFLQLRFLDPRLVGIAGDAAVPFARPGQVVVVETGRAQVKIGWPCLVITRDGVFLRRKIAPLRYEPFNPAYPVREVIDEELIAEFWAPFVLDGNLVTITPTLATSIEQRDLM